MAKRRKSGSKRPPPTAPPPRRTEPPARPAAERGAGPSSFVGRLVATLRRPHVVPVALLLLLHLALYRDVVFGGELLLGSGTDILSAQIPYRTAAAARLRSGELPLWDPAHFAGAPLLAAGQSGATYPPFWLLLPFSPPTAVSLSFVLHVFLAALFTYLLAWRLRRRTAGPRAPDESPGRPPTAPERLGAAGPLAAAGPFAAAVLVSLGGGVQAHVFAGHVNLVEAFAWLPAVLLALDALLERPGPQRAAWLAIAAALQLLAGHPQVSWLTAFAAAVWTVALLARPPWRPRLVALAWAAGAAVVAALLAALLLLPMLELAGDSHRQLAADPWRFATRFAAAPIALLQLLLAHPFGPPGAGSPAWWIDFGRWEPQGWIGASTALLAVVAVAARPCRRRLTLAGLAVAAVVLALGDATPLYRVFAAVAPGATLFRVPARFLLLAGLALPLLAGLGVDALVTGDRPRRLRIAVIAAAVTLALPLVGLRAAFAESGPDSTAAAWVEAHGGRAARAALERGGADATRVRAFVAEPLRGAADDGLLWLLTVAGLAAALAFWPRRRARGDARVPLPAWLGVAVAGVLVTQAGRFAEPWIVAEADPRPPLTDALLSAVRATAGHDRVAWWEDRRWNVGMEVAAVETGGVAAMVRNVGGYDPAITWRMNDVLNLRRGLRGTAERAAGEDPGDFRHRLWMLWPTSRRARPGPAWDILAARAVVTRRAGRFRRAPGLTLVAGPAETASPYTVFAYDRAHPRAGLSYGALVEPRAVDRLARMAHPTWDPARLLLFEDVPEPLIDPPATIPSGGSVTWEADEPERLAFVVESDRPAYLRVSDAWRPGWTATVDDEPAPVHVANHAFRAVPVPAGVHRVEMVYAPASVTWGARLSLLGLVAALALLGAARLRRRRRTAPRVHSPEVVRRTLRP